MSNRAKFSEIAIGQEFEFASIEDFPYSGMERGPWVKVSARKYVKANDYAFDCRVGSVNVEVIAIKEGE